MKTIIDSTIFGSITIDGNRYDHDVIIQLNGTVEKRNKKLSKEKYGTSHIISKDEALFIYQKGAKRLIIGSGQYGQVEFSDEAAGFLNEKHCKVDLLPTPKAIDLWNKTEGDTIGLFHVTC
jgi:hypothetical protein